MKRNPLIIFSCLLFSFFVSVHTSSAFESARGIVFDDLNRNLKLDPGEKGIPGVMASNGKDVVLTDDNGRFNIQMEEGNIIFISKPAGYTTPLDENNLPRFYYIHQPGGSPTQKYEGIKPTGPLPKSIDFPLFKQEEPDDFDVLVFSDPHSGNEENLYFLEEDMIRGLRGNSAAFGIVLGDIAAGNLDLYPSYNKSMAKLNLPVYNLAGNHDLNKDLMNNRYLLETFKSHFGPTCYSFDYGKVHFIILYDVEYYQQVYQGKNRNLYRGKIGETNLQWIKNDLQYVPLDKLIVFCLHIPLYSDNGDDPSQNVADRNLLFDIIKNRTHLLVLAAHLHKTEHRFLGKSEGWMGSSPLHQIFCTAACGSWWMGPKDERGIPWATQIDGAPNGFHVFSFKGDRYTERFVPASLPQDFQLRISRPESKISIEEAGQLKIVVNVFDGSEHSHVECRLDDKPQSELQKTPMKDPYYEDLFDLYKNSAQSFIKPFESSHIWSGMITENLDPGWHRIHIKTTDQFGNVYEASKVFQIEKGKETK
jgi:signal peptidase I